MLQSKVGIFALKKPEFSRYTPNSAWEEYGTAPSSIRAGRWRTLESVLSFCFRPKHAQSSGKAGLLRTWTHPAREDLYAETPHTDSGI